METFELGNFQTTTGFTIPNAKLRYDTVGTLNETKDNAILFGHFLGSKPEHLMMWIGEDRPLNPNKFFIIMPHIFGGGFSSSPSNTPAPYDGVAFPLTTVADDVRAQQRLITEGLGIEKLYLVLGSSVGGLNTFHWAALYPDMVKRAAVLGGAPKPSAWTTLWLNTTFIDPVKLDPAWHDGRYKDQNDVQAGLRQAGHEMAVTLLPPAFYGEERWRAVGFSSVDDFVRGVFESFTRDQDPNNLISVSQKARATDVSAGGDMAAVLGRITAKMFVYSMIDDNMFTGSDSQKYANLIPGAKYRELKTLAGHLANFAMFEQDRLAVDGAIQEAIES
jgi:homoserine O-acetyltransferase